MHRLWGLAVLLAAGCLREKVQYCNNGALCPEPLVCTENAGEPYCGNRDEVDQCMGKADESPCMYMSEPNGYCRSSVCTQCNSNLSYCRYTTWTAMPAGVSDDLYAILVLAANDLYVAGKNGAFLHWDGTKWTRLPEPSTGDLRTLAGSSGTEIFTTISNEVFRYDGTGWAMSTPASPNSLFGLWSAGPGDVFAMGFKATTGHFVGSTWSYVSPFGENTLMLSPQSLNAAWGTAPNDILVAGTNGTVIRWNGTGWTQQPTGTTHALKAISGSSTTSDRYAVGFMGLDTPVMIQFTQGAWTDRTSAIATAATKSLFGVYVQDADDVFAVGGQGSVIHGAGASWTVMPQPTSTTTFNAIGGAGDDVFAVGNGGTVLRYSP